MYHLGCASAKGIINEEQELTCCITEENREENLQKKNDNLNQNPNIEEHFKKVEISKEFKKLREEIKELKEKIEQLEKKNDKIRREEKGK
ncbi:hypothetical protein KPH14_007957 [Odynerus spinipes]|uniref:Uncharacterized protein n=1 Tax=Odynerus spinipes TaxID=1348599 RepID=A0AAD9VNH2_9HYME|nr:hypothetical protein KPH14_007957 [Odynerus spinipes]